MRNTKLRAYWTQSEGLCTTWSISFSSHFKIVWWFAKIPEYGNTVHFVKASFMTLHLTCPARLPALGNQLLGYHKSYIIQVFFPLAFWMGLFRWQLGLHLCVLGHGAAWWQRVIPLAAWEGHQCVYRPILSPTLDSSHRVPGRSPLICEICVCTCALWLGRKIWFAHHQLH